MAEEKTLLQQIRDREQHVSKRIDAIKAETEATIASVKKEAEKTLKDAEEDGKVAADDIYRKKMAVFEAEVADMKKTALSHAGDIKDKGEKNLNAAVNKIVHHVTCLKH